MKKLISALCCALLLSACAGTPFKWDDARQLRTGMKPAEAVKLIGQPTQVSTSGDRTIYVWVYVNPLTMATRTLRVDFVDGVAVSAPVIPDGFRD